MGDSRIKRERREKLRLVEHLSIDELRLALGPANLDIVLQSRVVALEGDATGLNERISAMRQTTGRVTMPAAELEQYLYNATVDGWNQAVLMFEKDYDPLVNHWAEIESIIGLMRGLVLLAARLNLLSKSALANELEQLALDIGDHLNHVDAHSRALASRIGETHFLDTSRAQDVRNAAIDFANSQDEDVITENAKRLITLLKAAPGMKRTAVAMQALKARERETTAPYEKVGKLMEKELRSGKTQVAAAEAVAAQVSLAPGTVRTYYSKWRRRQRPAL
jgi:hypothetical protein